MQEVSTFVFLLKPRQFNRTLWPIIVKAKKSLLFNFMLPKSITGLLFLFPLLSAKLAAQGPITGFMPGPNVTDLALTYSYEQFDAYFFGSEKQNINNQVRSVNLFVEHGWSDSLSVVANIPYSWADEENKGFQDGALFVKYRNKRQFFPSGSLTHITAAGLSFPLSRYPVQTDNPIGQRATQLHGKYLLQYKINNGLFFHLQGGLEFQISPNNQTAVPVLFRWGWGGSAIYFDAWLEYYHAFNSGADRQILGGEGSRWLKTGGVFFLAFSPEIGIFVGGSQILSGRNIGQSTRINAGLVYKWNRKRDG